MQYLIAYDIAHPKRLQKVARRLEKSALRCQKSVFLFHGGPTVLEALMDELAALINRKEDIIQAWRIADGQPPLGMARGALMHLYPSGAVLDAHQDLFLEEST